MFTFYCLIGFLFLYGPSRAIPAVPFLSNWDNVYLYTFDYERIQNETNVVIRRVTFSTAVHLREDIDNHNTVIAFFEQPVYDHDDPYHRNQYFKDKLEGISLPFKINYHRTGLTHNIATDPMDNNLSAQFKKTLASLVQLDWGFINSMADRHNYDYNFTTPEVTIFGECDVRNTVTQIGEGRIVLKQILMETCIRNKAYSRSNVTVEFRYQLSRERHFHLATLNGVEYVPNSDCYSVLTQRLEFVERIRSRMEIDSSRLTVERVIVL